MAKEIIPPDPIPVRENPECNDENYCATFMNYADDSYSDISKSLLEYLESEYDSNDLGGSTRSFIARNMTKDSVWERITDEFSDNISALNLAKHLILNESGDDVIIFIMLY